MGDYSKPLRRLDLYRDGKEIEKVFQLAVREALKMHKCMGNPIAIWRDGKVVIVPPEEIEIPPDPFAYRDEANLDAW
jgi:hypothetical protein